VHIKKAYINKIVQREKNQDYIKCSIKLVKTVEPLNGK